MSTKSLFFIMPNLGGGGGERVASLLLNNFSRKKFVLHLVLIKKDGDNSFIEHLNNDIQIHQLDVSTRIKYSFPLVVYRLIRLLKKENADILFAGSGQINVLLSIFFVLFPKGIKKVARETNIPSVFEKHRLLKFSYKLFLPNYDVIITQSDDMKRDLIVNFEIPASKIVKINNPIDTSFISKELGKDSPPIFPTGKLNLLAVGRLTNQKGFDLLIDTVSGIKGLDFALTILGEGEERYRLEKLIKERGLSEKVYLRGNVPNPYPHMRDADVFVLSSRFEGFPNVLLESLYCGTPVLANNCLGGIGEIVLPGINGEIFDFNVNGDFENKLIHILNQKWNSDLIQKETMNRYSVVTKILEFENKILQQN